MNRNEMKLTESIVGEEIEGVTITIIWEFVVRCRQFLQALRGYAIKISCELAVLCQNYRSPGNEAINQRLLSHPFNFVMENSKNLKREKMAKRIQSKGK